MKEQTEIRGKRAFTVYSVTAYGYSNVYWQAVNPRTGKPWQRRHNINRFHGDDHEAQALACWQDAISKFEGGK